MDLFTDHPPPSTGPHPEHLGRLVSSPIAGTLARVVDPDTSYEAAELHQRTGKLDRHAAKVWRLLKRFPGRTSVELFDQQFEEPILERHEISRRLDTLRKQSRARKGPKRPCSIKKTSMATWFPVLGPEARR